MEDKIDYGEIFIFIMFILVFGFGVFHIFWSEIKSEQEFYNGDLNLQIIFSNESYESEILMRKGYGKVIEINPNRKWKIEL